MTDTLREKLVSLVSGIVPVTLSESEVGEYPYCTYEMRTEPTYAKDRVARIMGETNLFIVSKVFSEADGIRAEIEEAIASGMSDAQWGAKLTATSKTCYEGVWTIELNYTLIQKS